MGNFRVVLTTEYLLLNLFKIVTISEYRFDLFQGRKLSGDRRAYSNICLGLNEIDELSLLMKKLET